MKNWKKTEIVFVILLVVIIIAASCVLLFFFREYRNGDDIYESLHSYVFLPEEDPESPSDGAPEGSTGTQSGLTASPLPDSADEFYLAAAPTVDFDSLQSLNSDCIGWIYSPNTYINYPIMQGTDNSYYLDHMYNGAVNSCGAIFMDCLNTGNFTDQNSIIYGHHMQNGAMFASLMNYSQQEYYDTHSALWIINPEGTHRVNLFAGFLTEEDSDVWQISFANNDDFQEWLDNISQRSCFKSDIVPTVEDHIVTLSTCTYETGTSRFVVVGVME